MVFSRYNIIVDDGNHFVIFNTLSGSLIRIIKDKYNEQNRDLIQGGFLVKSTDNELSRYKYLYYSSVFLQKSLNITIATTMNCNLCCPYCFEEGNKNNIIMQKDVEDAIVRYLLSQKHRQIFITWFGGEPLLNQMSINNISLKLTKNDISFKASIVTNGTLLSDNFIMSLENNHIESIQVTFDGPKDIHNGKRFFVNGMGSFDIILSNVKKVLRRSKCNVIIKTNLDKNNIYEYVGFKEYLTNEFNSFISQGRLTITENYVRNRTDFSGCSNCLTEQEYFDFQYNILGKNGFLPSQKGSCPLRSNHSFIIGPDGFLYKCLEYLGDHSKSIGSILNHSFRIQDQANYIFNYSPFEDKECCNCNVLPICGGGCPIDRKNKTMGKDINICSVFKMNVQEIISNYYHKQSIE